MGGSQVDDRGHGFQAEEGSGGRQVSLIRITASLGPSLPFTCPHRFPRPFGDGSSSDGLGAFRAGCCRRGFSLVCRVVGGTFLPPPAWAWGLEGLGSSTPPGASSLPLPLHVPAWLEFSGLSESGRPDALEDLGHKQVNINHRIYSQGKPVWAGCLEERQVLSLPPG